MFSTSLCVRLPAHYDTAAVNTPGQAVASKGKQWQALAVIPPPLSPPLFASLESLEKEALESL